MIDLITKAVHSSGAIEMGILIILCIFSILSWALILMKMRTLASAKRNNEKLLKLFDASDSVGEFTPPAFNGPAPLAAVFIAAVDTLEKASHRGVRHVPMSSASLHEKVMQRMQHTSKDEMGSLRWGSSFLATAGSATPFIGLLGTVWGIMATFQALGDAKSASLNVVAPGIASALIATAAGLIVAIPAVMFYNWILSQIEGLQEEADTFIERMDLMTRIEYEGGAPASKTGATAHHDNGEPAASVISEPFLEPRNG